MPIIDVLEALRLLKLLHLAQVGTPCLMSGQRVRSLWLLVMQVVILLDAATLVGTTVRFELYQSVLMKHRVCIF